VTTRRDGRYKFHDVDTSPLKAIAERWPGDRDPSDTTTETTETEP
jgi:hypothetical protein